MKITLDKLDLNPDELAAAEEAVRKLAYQKWEDAGKPETDGSVFWNEAEQEWIALRYVPRRRWDSDGE